MKRRIKISEEDLDQNQQEQDYVQWGDENHVIVTDVKVKNKNLLIKNRFDFGNEAGLLFYNIDEIQKPKRANFVKKSK